MKIPTTTAQATRSPTSCKRDLPADSEDIVSPIWAVPNSTQKPYTTTLREGDWVNLEWEGGTANDTVDLWLASSDFTKFHFSQLITTDGEFNWTVHVPEAQLYATPQYTLMFKTARSDFEFNSSDPGFPSPGVVILPPGAGLLNTTAPTHNEKDHDHGDDESESDGESESGDEEDDEKDEKDAAGVSGLLVSSNATCGGTLTCIGSAFGNCCSQFNFCGSTSAYCEAGCRSGLGDCDPRFLSVAATAASNSTGQPPPHLSAGATAGVATAIGVSVLGMGILSWFWLRRFRRKQRQQKIERQIQTAKYFGDDSGGTMAKPQRPYTSADATRAAGLPAPSKAYYAGAMRPSRPTSTHSSKRSSMASTPRRQSEIFEMQGGEKPYEYGRSPPAELYGSSIKEEKD
ncbi:chitin binding protein [Ophiostoma piceae UAMH 11346]|uniref:Chitin binding protein n=1 Tax=Ophiostoma piceae (strain UAMH 11346) TaxID=1262450 RepID=S3CQ53_OPHP1|nr:chitin binding protein [Ophiostoma piceae UAMH 11346]